MLPLMGLGTFIGMELDYMESKERMQRVEQTLLEAFRIGYRHIDLAEAYDNLPAIGRALKTAMKPLSEGGLGISRSELWLTMKSNSDSLESIQGYIDTLGCDYLDSYLLHHPYMYAFEKESILLETWKKVAEFPKELVRTVGVSNCYMKHIERLLSVCKKYGLQKPFSNEIESNLLCPNHEVIALCQANDIQVIAYSPIGYQYADSLSGNNCMFGSALVDVSQEIGATPTQTALAWHMARGIAVIPKSTQRLHLEENFQASKYLHQITADTLKKLEVFNGLMGSTLTSTAEDAKRHSDERLSWQVSTLMPNALTTHSIFNTSLSNTDVEDSKEDANESSSTASIKK